MAYCSKCGVELEAAVERCPLCAYPVPEDLIADTPRAFPEAENAYTDEAKGFRNKVFYIYFMMAIAGITIAVVLETFFSLTTGVVTFLKYGVLSIIASLFYLFFLLGYIQKLTRTLIGIGITTCLFTLALDALDTQLSWSLTYALPIAVTATVLFTVTAKLYARSKHTRHIIFVPVYVCLALCLLLPVIEIIISLNLRGAITLRWSLITTVSLLFFSAFLSGVYYKLPQYVKERLIRLFHI